MHKPRLRVNAGVARRGRGRARGKAGGRGQRGDGREAKRAGWSGRGGRAEWAGARLGIRVRPGGGLVERRPGREGGGWAGRE